MNLVELQLDDLVRVVGDPGIVYTVTAVEPLDRATRRQHVHLRNPDALNDRECTVQVVETLRDVSPLRVIVRSEP